MRATAPDPLPVEGSVEGVNESDPADVVSVPLETDEVLSQSLEDASVVWFGAPGSVHVVDDVWQPSWHISPGCGSVDGAVESLVGGVELVGGDVVEESVDGGVLGGTVEAVGAELVDGLSMDVEVVGNELVGAEVEDGDDVVLPCVVVVTSRQAAVCNTRNGKPSDECTVTVCGRSPDNVNENPPVNVCGVPPSTV